MEEINLHFTGDLHAVSATHNLLSAVLDNHLHHKGVPEINPRNLVWKRVIDMNDRSLRSIVVGWRGGAQRRDARGRIRDHRRLRDHGRVGALPRPGRAQDAHGRHHRRL
jgi:formyltetrahydrofolate synthetase